MVYFFSLSKKFRPFEFLIRHLWVSTFPPSPTTMFASPILLHPYYHFCLPYPSAFYLPSISTIVPSICSSTFLISSTTIFRSPTILIYHILTYYSRRESLTQPGINCNKTFYDWFALLKVYIKTCTKVYQTFFPLTPLNSPLGVPNSPQMTPKP